MSSNARCVQLSEELDESIKELQSMEEHHTESKAEIKKVTSLCSGRVGEALVESPFPRGSCARRTVSKAANGIKGGSGVGAADLTKEAARGWVCRCRFALCASLRPGLCCNMPYHT